MAIPVDQFQADTFAQANPGITGFQAQQQLLARALANQSQATQNQYAPQLDAIQESLAKAKLPYLKAQTNLLQKQTQFLPEKYQEAFLKSQTPLGKAMLYHQQMVAAHGANSPEAQLAAANVKRIAYGSGGLSVTATPGGGFTITQGGLQFAPGQSAQGTPPTGQTYQGVGAASRAMVNPQGNLVPSPGSPNSKYSTGGLTWIDPKTGNAISVPTTQTASLDQQTIIGAERVKPMLQRLYKEMAPFRTAKGDLALYAQGAGNYFLGQNNPLPSVYAAGQGDLATAPEGLLRAYGLRVSHEALELMKSKIKPYPGESGQQYGQRILNTLQELKQQQEQAASQLRGGIPLQGYGASNGNNQSNSQSTRTLKGKTYVQIDGKWYQK